MLVRPTFQRDEAAPVCSIRGKTPRCRLPRSPLIYHILHFSHRQAGLNPTQCEATTRDERNGSKTQKARGDVVTPGFSFSFVAPSRRLSHHQSRKSQFA